MGAVLCWTGDVDAGRVAALGDAPRAMAAGVGQARRCVQVVDTQLVRKKHVGTEALRVWRAFAVPAVVQELGTWADRPGDAGADVYSDGQPDIVDIAQLLPWAEASRRLVECQLAASDVQGCWSLSQPQAVSDRVWLAPPTGWAGGLARGARVARARSVGGMLAR